MNLPKVPGTKIRGTIYNLNLPIPKAIQHLYSSKALLRRTLKTSDPKDAERQVREQRAVFDRQLEEVQRLASRYRVIGSLRQEDRDLLAEIGGPDKLLQTVRDLRAQIAFSEAGAGADVELAIETGSVSGHASRVALAADKREHEARTQTLTAEVRRLKTVAATIGEEVPPALKGIDEGGNGARELAAEFTKAEAYTVKNAEKVRNTVRRWIEFHGDLPVERWERRHLDEFDEALTRMTSSSLKAIRSANIHDAIKLTDRNSLPLLSYKTRKTYIDHMKSLTKYAVNRPGLIAADPFAGYKPRRERLKHSAKKESDTIPYTPEQVGRILDHSLTKFDGDTADHWLPLIAAYTGARREEIGQLMVENVKTLGNFHVFDITDMDPLQTVKNEHSVRVIPIPTEVLNHGFLEFVTSRRQAGGKLLFLEDFHDKQRNVTRQEMSADKYGRFTENYGHRFRRKVRIPLGLTEDGMNFHSLRHSWADAARRAKIDKEIRRLIAGRLDGEDPTEAAYGGAELLPEKSDALERVGRFIRN